MALSEFEEYRNQRIKDDFLEQQLLECEPDDVACPDCQSVSFRLNTVKGIYCSDCGAVVDIAQVYEDE